MTIAAFDFDGTITQRDSFWLFLRYSINKYRLIWGLALLSPILILYKLRLYPNWRAKERLFSFFFRGMHIDRFNELCHFFLSHLIKDVRAEALLAIRRHKSDGNILIIISASIENWIMPLAESMNIHHLLSTQIEVSQDGYITGKFFSRNCFGKEKVNRLMALYPNRKEYTLFAYGDSVGDKELLKFSDYGYYRKF